MKKTLNFINHAIFYSSIIVIIISSLTAFSAKFNIPGGFRIYSVLTGSMKPSIPVGALIVSKIPTSVSDISKGNIITFSEPGFKNKYVTHRVYQVISQGNVSLFQTKGDANKDPDSWRIAYGGIKGIYQLGIPYLGYFLEFLKSLIGVIIFVFIPLIIIAAFEIKNIFQILFAMKLQKNIEKSENTTFNNNAITILVVLGVTFFCLTKTSTFALLSANPVKILANQISTSSPSPIPSPSRSPGPTDFPSLTPSPSISPTPTGTPSTTPTPSSECGNTTIIVSGNGEGATNTVTSNCNNNTTINQTNNTTINNTVNNNQNSGGNSNTTKTSSSNSSVNILNSSSSNSVITQ